MSDRPLALVTGAAGGIGLEVSKRLSGRGYRVIAVERDGELAERAAADIGGGAFGVACDLGDREATAALGARIAGEWASDLEVLICNAGVMIPGDVGTLSGELVDLHLDVMLVGAIRLISAAVPGMRARDRGHILATVSIGGILSLPGSAHYSAAKAGLRAYLAGLHGELRGTNVAVTGVFPSAVATPMLHHEATHGGSLLNFIGAVSTVERVADAYDRALATRKLEVFVPYPDSLLARLLSAFPWVLPHLLGPMEWLGRRGRDRYVQEHGLTMAPPAPPAA